MLYNRKTKKFFDPQVKKIETFVFKEDNLHKTHQHHSEIVEQQGMILPLFNSLLATKEQDIPTAILFIALLYPNTALLNSLAIKPSYSDSKESPKLKIL
jgi:hypothetical protein